MSNLKNDFDAPLRYYQVSVSGKGSETAYISISEEAHAFWESVLEDDDADADAVEYCLNAESGEMDFEGIDDVPNEAQFLLDSSSGEIHPWYDAPTEYAHLRGANVDDAFVCVQELETSDSSTGSTLLSEMLSDLYARLEKSADGAIDLYEYPDDEVVSYPNDDDYTFLFGRAEEGRFFHGVVSTDKDFDLNKLQFVVREAPNGEEMVLSVTYAGDEIESAEDSTDSVGYFAHTWMGA